ncbi:hypothetical protein [Bacillus sp. 7894-2]|uniref:hypothetical protein n=1 Tax=Bacillus sp. 7894-2 TaxID=2021695 RepID=UPI000BA73F99|nr:hypothetical protein [Bacillus sp. 7894-2]PAE24062.1 hypothetical protein CHI10_14765 [Bacillus sp. 7894-2]
MGNEVSEAKYEYGIWTPTAHVICHDCHEAKYNFTGKRPLNKPEPAELSEGCAVTYCDFCGKDIQLDDEVAGEHNAVKALQERGIPAVMAQTGGMNSAVEIELKPCSESEDDDFSEWLMIKAEGNTWWLMWNKEDGDWEEEGHSSDIEELAELTRKAIAKYTK